MYRLETLYLNPNLIAELEKLNTEMVGYIIKKTTKEVVNVAVVKRTTLGVWYKKKQETYSEHDFMFVVGSISIVGEIKGAYMVHHDDDGNPVIEEDSVTRKTYDPKNHVN